MKRLLELVFIGLILFLILHFGKNWLAAYLQNKGVISYTSGNFTQAVNFFKRSLALNPKIAITHYNLGNSFASLKKDSSALAEYKKALLLDNKNTLSFKAIIKLMTEKQLYIPALKEIALAEPELLKSPQIDALIKQVHFAYSLQCLYDAQKAFEAQDMSSALSFAKKALQLKPDFAVSHYVLASLCYYNKKTEAAIAYLEKACEIDPKFWAAYKLIGDIRYYAEEYKEAIIYYKRAFLLNSNDAVLCNDLGLTLMKIESYSEAIMYLNKALNLSPDNANIRYSLASVYRDNLMPQQALAEYNKLNEKEPFYPNMHNDMGDIYILMGDKYAAFEEYEKEIICANKLINQDHANLVAKNNLANAYAGLEKYDIAQKVISEVIGLSPNYRQAYLTLARIQEKRGELNKAIGTLERAKMLSRENNFIERDKLRVKKLIVSSVSPNVPKDKIYLKNGRVLEGKVIEETNDIISLEIVLGSTRGSITLRKNEINNIKKAD